LLPYISPDKRRIKVAGVFLLTRCLWYGHHTHQMGGRNSRHMRAQTSTEPD